MDSREWIYGQLACPACKQPLTKAIDLLICNGCSTAYQQTDKRFIDLMLPEKDLTVAEAWNDRLKQMDAWYDDLVSHPESAKRLLDNDLGLFPKEIFSGPGPVLDVGGGSGHTRNFLYPDTRYICLDPDLHFDIYDNQLLPAGRFKYQYLYTEGDSEGTGHAAGLQKILVLAGIYLDHLFETHTQYG